MKATLESAVSAFGSATAKKFKNPSATGQPEDQLRAPFETLLADLAELAGIPRNQLVAVGESTLSALQTRPDYAITVKNTLVGFVEIKAPGKGADPRKFKDAHDKGQWERLRSLPNLIYTDGNAFSLWQDGELVDTIVVLEGDIESSGSKLQPAPGLIGLFTKFLRWEPIPPSNAKDLAEITARLCRLLRDEVTEQLALRSEALTALAADWRKLLFPEASDERFADGYAQAVTFGMLMARAKEIRLATGLPQVANELSKSSSLIGAALRLLTDNAENQDTLKTSLGTLTRVLDAVTWSAISKGRRDTWLYFYEDFLEVYDNQLRKQTGSYYTPPEVVGAMVRLVDDVLKSPRFGQHAGLAAPAVTLADPATGTGTFLLGVLRRIAETVAADEGQGAVSGAIDAAVARLIAFEMQLGPFAVAQLRVLAEILELTGATPKSSPRMFVTNTLGNPEDDEGWIPGILAPIAKSRKDANKIKRDEPITVVLGNPPYKEKAKGLGGWVEGVDARPGEASPLSDWMPPAEWGAGAHSKHLRNLYIYFWRWATWKVFDHHPAHSQGIVCYITVAGFLSGPGFQKMRDYLRRACDDLWIIDCSPEGHQPNVPTRIFQGVQQPVCIVLASRSGKKKAGEPAHVRFQSLPLGKRDAKFAALAKITLGGKAWIDCPTDWRAPFLPIPTGAWATFPKMEELFEWNGSGVMPGRTWIIAPDAQSLENRWQKLVTAPDGEKEALFHPHLRKGKLGDKHSKKIVTNPLAGFAPRLTSVADDKADCIAPIPYAFRSFDRQWIIPDSRLINQANPELWKLRSNQQVYLTAFSEESPTSGPAFTVTGLIPDLHHYKGSFGGRVFPLWRDAAGTMPNLREKVLAFLGARYGFAVSGPDLFAYLTAVAAHPDFTARFQEDLATPGLRIPFTADPALFAETVALGRNVIWLHTFGERFADAPERPSEPPRLPADRRPRVSSQGAIPSDLDTMPDTLGYDEAKQRLLVGRGFVENVPATVWNYEVSGKQVLLQWFSYRKKDRERPIIGDRRQPSQLGNIQPDHWLPAYTTELLNLLNVLGRLVDLEPVQKTLLDQICSGPTFSEDAMRSAGAFELVKLRACDTEDPNQTSLFSTESP